MARWIQAGTIDNRFEGDRIAQAMEEAGVPYLIKSFLDTAYNGLYVLQKGWGTVMVPEEHRDRAERIVTEVKTSFQKEESNEVK